MILLMFNLNFFILGTKDKLKISSKLILNYLVKRKSERFNNT